MLNVTEAVLCIFLKKMANSNTGSQNEMLMNYQRIRAMFAKNLYRAYFQTVYR